MKYIITDHNKLAMGSGCLHQDLAYAVTGNVVSAGRMRIIDGRVEVYGKSDGYDISAKPEDAKFIEDILLLK